MLQELQLQHLSYQASSPGDIVLNRACLIQLLNLYLLRHVQFSTKISGIQVIIKCEFLIVSCEHRKGSHRPLRWIDDAVSDWVLCPTYCIHRISWWSVLPPAKRVAVTLGDLIGKMIILDDSRLHSRHFTYNQHHIPPFPLAGPQSSLGCSLSILS